MGSRNYLIGIQVGLFILTFLLLLMFIAAPLLEQANFRGLKPDFQYHDTYFVVASVHYLLAPALWMLILVWVYLKMSDTYLDSRVRHVHFVLTLCGIVAIVFLPTQIMTGLPRRYVDYPLAGIDLSTLNFLTSAGFWVFLVSQAGLIVYLIIRYFLQRKLTAAG